MDAKREEKSGRCRGEEEEEGCARFARFLARSFIREGPLPEIKPGKSPEARIAAFLRRLLSTGDILSAITTVFRRRRCRGSELLLSRSPSVKRAGPRARSDKAGLAMGVRYRIEP